MGKRKATDYYYDIDMSYVHQLMNILIIAPESRTVEQWGICGSDILERKKYTKAQEAYDIANSKLWKALE